MNDINKMAKKLDELISKLDGAAGRLIVPAMKNETIKESMEMVSEVSIELGELIDIDDFGIEE